MTLLVPVCSYWRGPHRWTVEFPNAYGPSVVRCRCGAVQETVG